MPHSTTWDPANISTTWFDSHFNHAASRVLDWIGAELDLQAATAMMDFGCGGGITTLGVALRHPQIRVHGVDIGDKFRQLPDLAKEQLHLQHLPDNLHFHQIEPLQVLAEHHAVDAVFSWSVFEHVPQSQIPVIFADRKRPRIDTFFQNTISHRLSPVPPQRRRMPWPRPTVLTASPSGRITSPPGRYRT